MSCNGPYLCQVELDRKNGVATLTVSGVNGPSERRADGTTRKADRVVGTPSQAVQLGELPASDAAHVQWSTSVMTILDTIADAIAKHREALITQGNFHMDTVEALEEAAITVHEAGHDVGKHATAYRRTYAGVRETAGATDGKIPGIVPGTSYWSETSH